VSDLLDVVHQRGELPLHADLARSSQREAPVKVSGNWRVTFGFIGKDVEKVDYEDYH
jgi:plasmid maintenance system killer protein